MQKQRACATGAVALSVSKMSFDCSKLQTNGSEESKLADAVPELLHLPAALRTVYGENAATAVVNIHATLGLPRPDEVHSHPAFFKRTQYNLALDDVAYQGAVSSSSGDVLGVYYAQVVAVGSLNANAFVFCRGYESSGTADNPVRLQPLV